MGSTPEGRREANPTLSVMDGKPAPKGGLFVHMESGLRTHALPKAMIRGVDALAPARA